MLMQIFYFGALMQGFSNHIKCCPNKPLQSKWRRSFYLDQRVHQRFSIWQSFVVANCGIIPNFVIYKWHEDDSSGVSDSATAGKMLAQQHCASLAASAPLVLPGRCFIQQLKVEKASFPGQFFALPYFPLATVFQSNRDILWKPWKQ